MKKLLIIGGVVIILLLIGLFALGNLGFKSKQLENIEARLTPNATVEKVVEYYKSSEAIDKKLFYKFHSEDFERLVTENQLTEYWNNTLKLKTTSNLSVQTITEDKGEAVVEVLIRDQQNKKFQVYLDQIPGRENSLIWEIYAYKYNESILGNLTK